MKRTRARAVTVAAGWLGLFLLGDPAHAQLPPSNALIINQTQIQGGSNGQCLFINSTTPASLGSQACGGSGSVTSVSVVTANGVSGSVATPTTTPAITLTLGAITPTSVNGNTITTGTGTLTLGSVTLNAGAGGTLGSNAFTSIAYAPIASPTFTGTVTLPLVTLGGTVSGGGSQINNVIIGTVTPLAGTFTTLIANTSVSSPIHTASGSLTFQSNGSTFAGSISTGQQWELGANVAPLTGPILTLNQNTVAAPGAVTALTPALHIVGANAAFTGFVVDSFGSGSQDLYIGRQAFGTAASPTQVNTASTISGMTGQAYDDTATYRSVAAVDLVTAGAVTSTNWSGLVRFRTGTTGSTFAQRAQVQLGLTVGDTTDPGIGGLRATGATVQLTGLGTDAAQVDATVCRVAASGLLVTGTGALGICLGTSGAQFKTAFAPMQAGLTELMQIDFQNYRYRPGFGDSGAAMQYGTTAQNVEGPLPDLVRHAKSGEALNFDSGALMFIGLHAVQELKVSADRIEARLARLEGK